jgi:hypothetical protein
MGQGCPQVNNPFFQLETSGMGVGNVLPICIFVTENNKKQKGSK